MYDPYLLFNTNELRFSAGDREVRLSCPHPAHSHHRGDTNASFNMETGSYICFGNCGFQTKDIVKLANWLNMECGVHGRIGRLDEKSIKYRSEMDQEKSNPYNYLSLPLATNSSYLLGRKVSQEVIEHYDIRHTPDDSIIAMPNYNYDKRLLGVNLRFTTRKKMRYQYLKTPFSKNRPPLYNLKDIYEYDSTKPLYITEGAFGVFRLRSLDFTNQVVAVLGSGGLKELDLLSKYRRIILCYDHDEGGHKNANQVIMKNKKFGYPIYIAQAGEYDEIQTQDEFLKMTDTKKHLVSDLYKTYLT